MAYDLVLSLTMSEPTWLDGFARRRPSISSTTSTEISTDNRLNNLRVTTSAGNLQNVRRAGEFIGVRFRCNRWEVRIKVKDENRSPPVPSRQVTWAKRSSFTTSQRSSSTTLARFSTNRLSRNLSRFTCRRRGNKGASRGVLVRQQEVVSSYGGVQIRKDCASPTFMTVVWNEKEKPKRCEKVKNKGAEIRTAIFWDLWRLKLNGQDLAVNFEWLRPWYLHQVPTLTREKEASEVVVKRAYDLLGGDTFADAEAARMGGSVHSTSLSATSAFSSGSRKRKAST